MLYRNPNMVTKIKPDYWEKIANDYQKQINQIQNEPDKP